MLDMAWIYFFMTFMVWLTGSHSPLHENYEQALMTLIQTVAIKDNIAQLLRNILELYTGGGGVKDAEQDSDRASRLLHLIRCCLHCWPKWSLLDSCESCCLDFVRIHLFAICIERLLVILMWYSECVSGCSGEVAKRILKVVERRFPAELDSAVSACLQVRPSNHGIS